MFKLGLTGSIAVGKSFVCDVLREQEFYVLDADKTAREVVGPGTEGLAAIVETFGREMLNERCELDRRKMAGVVFSDDAKRKILNSIIHPLVYAAQEKWMREIEAIDSNGVAVVDAALMIESGGYTRFRKLIVVWCEPAIQLKRLMLRDNLSAIDANKRINAQMPQDEKKRYADFLIDTSHGLDDTRRQTLELAETLRGLAVQTDGE